MGYVLKMSINWGPNVLIAVFSTRERAEDAKRQIEEKYPDSSYDYKIDEIPLNPTSMKWDDGMEVYSIDLDSETSSE